MKNKSRSQTVLLINRIINVRAWFDFSRMRSFTLYLTNGVKALFVPQKEIKKASFDKAVTQLNLNDVDLLAKQNALFRLSKIMFFGACLILVYAGYQLFFGSFKAVLVSLVVTLIALTLAFRYHFWYFQIKERKLGCTFRQWFRQGLLREKNE